LFDLIPNDVERVVHAAFRSLPRLYTESPTLGQTKNKKHEVRGVLLLMDGYLEALDHLNARRFEEADKALEAALSSDPGDENAALLLCLRSDALLGLGRYREAEDAAQCAVLRDPHDILRIRDHTTLQMTVARSFASRPVVDMESVEWVTEISLCSMGGRKFFVHDALEAVPHVRGFWSVRVKRALPKQTALFLVRPFVKMEDVEAAYCASVQERMERTCPCAPAGHDGALSSPFSFERFASGLWRRNLTVIAQLFSTFVLSEHGVAEDGDDSVCVDGGRCQGGRRDDCGSLRHNNVSRGARRVVEDVQAPMRLRSLHSCDDEDCGPEGASGRDGTRAFLPSVAGFFVRPGGAG
jgi:hypothetical protein